MKTRNIVLFIFIQLFAWNTHAQSSLLEKYIGFNYSLLYNTHQSFGIGTISARNDFYQEFAPITDGEFRTLNSFTAIYGFSAGVRYHRLKKGFWDVSIGLGESIAGFSAEVGEGNERIEVDSRIKFFNIPVGVFWGWEFNKLHIKVGATFDILMSPKSDAETRVWSATGTDGHQKVMEAELFYQNLPIEGFVKPIHVVPQVGAAVGYNWEEIRLMAGVKYQRSDYLFRNSWRNVELPYGDPFNSNHRLQGLIFELSAQLRLF